MAGEKRLKDADYYDEKKTVVDYAGMISGKVKDFFGKIKELIGFVTSTIGQIIAVVFLVLFIVFLVFVAVKTIEHKIGMVFHDDYAGIAKQEDYDVIVGSLSATGYDAYISEEKWQEYAAFEYAVLMDVAEYLYQNQDYLVKATDVDGNLKTNAAFPEGITYTEYDQDAVSKEWWREAVVEGQSSGEYMVSSQNTTQKKILGGNREVTTPRLVYELATNDYQGNAISLMPYIMIVREDINYNYFLTDPTELDVSAWRSGAYGKNLKDINLSSLNPKSNSIEPVRFSAELNRYNYEMPSSAYTKDLEEQQNKKEVMGVQDPEGFVDADRFDFNKNGGSYGDTIYYTENASHIVYKIPLRTLINRYLPKSTLLTTWYMIKPEDDTSFKIDDLMKEIKNIYNAACYQSDVGKQLEVVGYINENGDQVDGLKPGSPTNLRIPESDFGTSMVDGVSYDQNGAIVRDADGKAKIHSQQVQFANSNLGTFIYFEQFGLETSRYEKFKVYLGPSGENAPYSGDEALPNAEAPSANYLTRERVNFISALNLAIKGISYENDSGDIVYVDDISPDGLHVKLKTTYDIQENNGADYDRIKNNVLYRTNLSMQQDAPYELMKFVVSKAESLLSNKVIRELSGDGEYKVDHNFINKLYIPAEIGNYDELQKKYGSYENILNHPEEIRYKLIEDYRFYNQNPNNLDDDDFTVNNFIPHWYDLKVDQNGSQWSKNQEELEEKYLSGFAKVYADSSMEQLVKIMLTEELSKQFPDFVKLVSYERNESCVNYSTDRAATLYVSEGGKLIHNPKESDVKTGDYRVNYYWEGVYNIKEKKLQMRQLIHHRRMPALFVKYCDFWAKKVEYQNTVFQNPINIRNYRYLIPDSVNSLGLSRTDLVEKAHYRVNSYSKFFNKKEKDGKSAIKEADVLDMLVQWENYGNESNEVAYAYMRELYKLVIEIRDSENTMLDNAYTFLYIPHTISNFDDATVQKIFWLERLGVSQGEDELTEEEEKKTRTKGIELTWQNVEYPEYEECITDEGSKERVSVYALFPFGSSYVRAGTALAGWDELESNPFGGGHDATDICSRSMIKRILNHTEEKYKDIYYYELNRLTLKYMRSGNRQQDAFILAENELNQNLKEEALYSPVVAVAPGVVTYVDYTARSGFQVKIAHPKKYSTDENVATTFYCHLKRWPLVNVGDYVGAGTVIGYEGTTGRSTGNHLHLELKLFNTGGSGVGNATGTPVDPEEYITPIFSPFYYGLKAVEALKNETALGSEYYKLERTIVPDYGLFNQMNVINGMTLSDGSVVNYTAPSNHSGPYQSGEIYSEGSMSGMVWGNNVPQKAICDNYEEEYWDLSNLNRVIPYIKEQYDDGKGPAISYNKEVFSNPEFFKADGDFAAERLVYPKWYAVKIAEYKSPRVVPSYNGPQSPSSSITEEGIKDLKAIQDSLRAAGYYVKAEVDFEEASYGEYSTLFAEVVSKMQEDLIKFGYPGITANGNLDRNTISAYNTMMQYTNYENQEEIAKKISYKTGVGMSFEPALIQAIVQQESNNLCLKEPDATCAGVKVTYLLDTKLFNHEQGLMQISPQMAVARYKEDNIGKEDAVVFIRQPLRNLNIGVEILKEYEIYFYENYSGDIQKARNYLVYGQGTACPGWKSIYDELVNLKDKAWCDPNDIDKLILYACALEAYDKYSSNPSEVTSMNPSSIITGGPSGYSQSVLNTYKTIMTKQIK